MVEFKADCYPAMVCGCWGPLFQFCDRYCAGSNDNTRPPSSSSSSWDNTAPANGNVGDSDYNTGYWWGQQQQQQQQNYYYPDNGYYWWQQPEPDRLPHNGYWERQPPFLP